MNNSPILTATHVSKTYRQGKIDVPVLHNINLTLQAQETIAIVGASGSGKSTLLHLLGGLDTPSAGKIELDGRDMAYLTDQEKSRLRNEKLGFVYQFHHLLPEFSALENVAMPLLIRRLAKKEAHARAAAMISQVGLAHRLHHTPGELSGGERQRIAIARALVTEPACLLADEPTGNLDQTTARAVLDLMLALNEAAKTAFIIVTHDMTLAAQTQKTYRIVDGHFEDKNG
jgi:lipoprotein-releasing system ATP-binding protein